MAYLILIDKDLRLGMRRQCLFHGTAIGDLFCRSALILQYLVTVSHPGSRPLSSLILHGKMSGKSWRDVGRRLASIFFRKIGRRCGRDRSSRTHRDVARWSMGDHRYLTAPDRDSYHTVWFEFHQDLIDLLGLTRQQEAAAVGRAV